MTPLFTTIAVEVASLCNRECAWCPVSYAKRADERMAIGTLTSILLQLGEMKYAGRVELYIYNEPTRDWGWLLDCIAAVRAGVPRACIMIATNGDYLRTQARVQRLFDAGLNQLLINCYTKGLYERRAHLLDGFERGNVYSNIGPRRRAVQMQDKHDPATFGTGVFRLVNRAGNVPGFLPPTTAPVERMCVKPFRMLNINWRGDALVCCQDYHGEVTVGNVRQATLTELWEGPVMTEYRRHLYRKDRSLPLCRYCDCHAGAYPHMVFDPFA